MDRRGQTNCESIMIVATALAIVAAGLAQARVRQPQRWDELAAAVSDVSRDVSWKLDDAVKAWRTPGSLQASLAAAEVPRPVSGAYLRPAPDPLDAIRALR